MSPGHREESASHHFFIKYWSPVTNFLWNIAPHQTYVRTRPFACGKVYTYTMVINWREIIPTEGFKVYIENRSRIPTFYGSGAGQIASSSVCATSGKPSTRLPLGGLVEHLWCEALSSRSPYAARLPQGGVLQSTFPTPL